MSLNVSAPASLRRYSLQLDIWICCHQGDLPTEGDLPRCWQMGGKANMLRYINKKDIDFPDALISYYILTPNYSGKRRLPGIYWKYHSVIVDVWMAGMPSNTWCFESFSIIVLVRQMWSSLRVEWVEVIRRRAFTPTWLTFEDLSLSSDFCKLVVVTQHFAWMLQDYIKEVLEEIGELHFGEMCMKPGKPSTFATVKFGDGQKRLFFGHLVKDRERKDTALIALILFVGTCQLDPTRQFLHVKVLVTVSGWKCHIPSIKTGLAIKLLTYPIQSMYYT